MFKFVGTGYYCFRERQNILLLRIFLELCCLPCSFPFSLQLSLQFLEFCSSLSTKLTLFLFAVSLSRFIGLSIMALARLVGGWGWDQGLESIFIRVSGVEGFQLTGQLVGWSWTEGRVLRSFIIGEIIIKFIFQAVSLYHHKSGNEIIYQSWMNSAVIYNRLCCFQNNITSYNISSHKNPKMSQNFQNLDQGQTTGDLNILAPQMQPRSDDYDQVQSIVVKRDQKGNVTKQWTQVIKIIRINKKKPFIGGFRKVDSDVECWNAYAQTDQKRTNHRLCFTRETQTYQWVSKSTKSKREMGTQMEKQGIFLDTRNDKVIQPVMYFNAEMWQERRNEAALFIQRLTRGWFARKRANALKKKKQNQFNTELEMEEKKRKSQEIRHKEEIQRRRNPKTKKDFEILYHELELWRVSELEKIRTNKSLTEQQRKRALKQTLDKEIDLLQTIDRLKIAANKGQKVQKIDKYLKNMSDPKQWVRKTDGRVTEVHTPFTIRAKQLMDLYKGLKMKNISTDERLDILLNTKWTVKEWDCNLTREIVQLIDREANMLDRGRPEKSLQGLRQRLANLFLQFIEYPLFNPEAARFQKIPYEISELAQKEAPTKTKS